MCVSSTNTTRPQTNAVQFILYFFLGRETLYLRTPTPSIPPPVAKPSYAKSLLSFGRINPAPLRLWDFVQPLSFVTRPCVVIPAAAYAMVFLWGNIVLSVETGQLYPELFHQNPQQVGLQNVAIIIGSVLGEQIGGLASDWWMWRRHKKGANDGSDSDSQGGGKSAAAPQPEFRLWLGYPGFLLTICGIVVYLVQIGAAGHTWNITPTVGMGIAAGGNQIVTTIMTTYAVDCYRDDAAAIGVFINFVRSTWGFIGPFWFSEMIPQVGFGASAGIAAAMMVGVSIIPTAVLQWKGRLWR